MIGHDPALREGRQRSTITQNWVRVVSAGSVFAHWRDVALHDFSLANASASMDTSFFAIVGTDHL